MLGLAVVALVASFHAVGGALAFLAGSSVATQQRSARAALRATATARPTPSPTQKAKLPSRLDGMSAEELEAYRAKATDLWESMKPDIKDELARYPTFRLDKFEAFMKADSRGLALFELYKPGTPEYAEFFEETMGPYMLELAKEKMGEGLGQAFGVVAIVGGLVAFFGFFGTDIIQAVSSPFTGFAENFVQLYGF